MMPQVRLAARFDSACSDSACSDSARHRFPVLAGGLAAILAVALLLGGCAGLPWGKQENLRGGYGPKDRVAAILPGSGPVAGVAEALRQGLRAAHGADDTATRPTLDFVASDQPEQIGEVYKKALAGGATQVIGPLLKPAVDVLAGGPALKVPTLALNQATRPGKTAANLYQFALAPETEAVDVANKAKAQGLTRALMLTPTGEAGQRRADAFRRQWKTLGGTLVGEASVDPALDPTKNLATLLAKGGADFLFLAVDAEQARQVYPILRGKAATLPMIATSAVFAGGSDAARDKALAGLYFVDAPWMLGVGADEDPLALGKLKRGSGALATPLGLRLYAMGIDAYRLTPRLATLAKTPGASFPGATGTLSIDAQGRVQRALTLAQFTPAGPRTVPTMAAPAGVSPGAATAAPAAGAAAKVQARPGAAAPPGSQAESAARPAATARTASKPKPKRTAAPKAKPVPEFAAPVPPATGPAPAAAPTPIANLASAPAAGAAPVPVARPEPRLVNPQPFNPQARPEPVAPAP